jgi:hypothetical protein
MVASHRGRTRSQNWVILVSWDQQFYDPIIVPGHKPLITLRDAALYFTKLPKPEHDAEEWQAAMQALLLVAAQNMTGQRCSLGSA